MKKTLSFLLAFIMLFSLLSVGAMAANTVLSAQKLTCEGESIECEKYNIDGSNYFKLRDIAYLLNGTVSQFSVGWDSDARVVSIVTGEAYEPNGSELVFSGDKASTAVLSSQTIKINGIIRDDLSVYNIGGSNFFKLRDLGGALGFLVDYDKATNTAVIKSLAGAENPDEWLLSRNIYCSAEGEVLITTDYTYDAAKRLIKEQDTYAEGTSATAYTYDAAGNRTSSSYYSGDGLNSWRTAYTYDDAGNMLSATDMYSDGGSTSTYYTYDAAGNMLSETYEGSGYYSKNEYVYDAAGNMLSSSFESRGETYSYSYKYEYSYDAAGNRLSETYSSSDGTMSTSLYSYDAAGNMLTSDYMSSSGYNSLSEYRYDSDGKLTSESYTSADSDGNTYNYETAYEYDAKGNMVREIFSGNSYSSETTYTYYDNGEMRSRNTDFHDGTYSYSEYAEDGLPLEFGYVDPEYSEISRYSYDALGNILSYYSSTYADEYFSVFSYDYIAGTYTQRGNEMYGFGGMG